MTNLEPSIARETAATTVDGAERKRRLREELLTLRSGISEQHRKAANRAIGRHLIAWQKRCGCATLAVFWPIRNEPDLQGTYALLAQAGVQLALPVVQGAAMPLSFVPWVPGQPMRADAFGVAIPAEVRDAITPQAILLPCLGFNAARVRLGYGGGFYDRTLALRPQAITVGVGYAACGVEFTAEAHDVALGSLITEHGIV